ncbi:IgGFc-binding protein-like [Haliotis rubra]|uniref:IgGFc-binding protein-like n=1 Tax=Haliotis rubra TaxID=36100 RepID=UPI001EE5F42B|nr:IgGFc-binding protein-like [Haliotis rubra]
MCQSADGIDKMNKTTNGQNSSGKEFLVTFPENKLEANKPEQQCIIITTLLNAASVQVTSLSLSINFTHTVNITSAEGDYICLEEGIQLSGSGITDKVVRIISDNDVNVLAVDFGFKSMDIYLALPVDQFGFSFYVVTYQSTNDKTQFSVTSSSADTSVTIEFPPGLTTLQYNGITILNPDIIYVTLQKHEVIQFQNDRDLTGTYVSSNNPTAVIAGARKSSLDTKSKRDHLVQQMPPVTTWGKHFVSVPSPEKTNTSEDLYRILASTSNTTVHVGGSIYHLEKEGDWLETRISATDPVEITSNEAILVVKFVTATRTFDPCMMIVHPNIQWQYQYSFRFPDTNTYAYAIVVIDSFFKSSLMLNSQPLDIQTWVDVMDTNLTSGYILLPKASYVIQSASALFGVYIHQKDRREAFCSGVGLDLTLINEVRETEIT